MLIFESDLVCFRGLRARTTQLELALINPALIGWRVFHILWHLHFAVQLELSPESFVWLDD